MLPLRTIQKLDLDEPVLIPYEIKVSNSTNSQPKILQFSDTRSVPFIQCPANFFMSVVRFQLQTPYQLPVFIPIIEPNQANVNQTIYKIGAQIWNAGTLSYDTFETTLIWESQTITSAPAGPVGSVQNNTDYYYCLHYQHFLNIINRALITLLSGAPPALTADKIPWFTLDQSTFNLVLNYSEEWCDYGTSPILYKLFMNEPLFTLFGTFPAKQEIINNARKWVLRPAETFDTSFDYPGTATDIFQTPTENTCLSQWNPIESIVFTSNLPIIATSTASGGIFNSTNFGNNSTTANLGNVISSFSVPFNANNSYRAYVNYTPTGELRLYDLISKSPLDNITITVYWSDWFGNLNPFILPAGCNANILLLFRRKDYNMGTETMLNF